MHLMTPVSTDNPVKISMNITDVQGIQELWDQTRGDPRICIAVLDGLVDLTHACFAGSGLTPLGGIISQDDENMQGPMASHGTCVASIIFGQHGSPVQGIAPVCRGLVIPIYSDRRRKLSQLDLSRAITQAVEEGAHVINLSGGQLTQVGEAEDLLEKAVQLCCDRNVLLVAAAGNDGCPCLHIPAAVPTALAVGAMDDQGRPLAFSNWGEAYRTQGILAPGDNIAGAGPGGAVIRKSGTSFATPVVSGVAALLLSLQLKQGGTPDPHAVRAAILEGAERCDPKHVGDCSRYLVGTLNLPGAEKALLRSRPMSESRGTVEPSRCSCGVAKQAIEAADEVAESMAIDLASAGASPSVPTAPPPSKVVAGSIKPSTSQDAVTPSQNKGLVFALGIVGYDFGTEARRDSFKQQMPPVAGPQGPVPANPYDARQLVAYLKANPSEAKWLIWTLNLELTPIYAIEPYGPYGEVVYQTLVDLLDQQTRAQSDADYVNRVSIPGVLTGDTVKLFSGQVLPALGSDSKRGIYGWTTNQLIAAAIEVALKAAPAGQTDVTDQVTQTVNNFLNRIYYDFRNLGVTSPERALNFAVTNIVQTVVAFSRALGLNKNLGTIEVKKSPYCRIDSDCWDVQLKFFDPENIHRSWTVIRFALDVSDKLPVTLGDVVEWEAAVLSA